MWAQGARIAMVLRLFQSILNTFVMDFGGGLEVVFKVSQYMFQGL